MTPSQYLDALHAVGVSRRLPVGEHDRRASELLGFDIRTARRYRCGERAIPAPVQVALKALALARKRREKPL